MKITQEKQFNPINIIVETESDFGLLLTALDFYIDYVEQNDTIHTKYNKICEFRNKLVKINRIDCDD